MKPEPVPKPANASLRRNRLWTLAAFWVLSLIVSPGGSRRACVAQSSGIIENRQRQSLSSRRAPHIARGVGA